MSRLSIASLGRVPAAMRPPVDPSAIDVGIVHLGIGAFHRAHQAVFTQAAMAATGDLSWGICGVTQRGVSVVDQLVPQDGLYTVLTRGPDRTTAEVNAAVRQVLPGVDRRAETVERLASPRIRVVTLTVTEKGYRHDPASGRLRRDDDGVRADAAGGSAPVTVVGQLVRGLQRRMRDGSGPVSIVCCDNLPSNGAVLRRLVAEFTELLDRSERDELLAWTAENVRFPATVVDRIVPATTDDDRADAARLLGLTDEGVVVAEPFTQWVIESDFAGARPAWERAGATLTSDVAPYEAMKLRLLNGAHSALAYVGALDDREHIADVVARPEFAGYARALMDLDVTPTLEVPAGFDVERYKDELLERFANPRLHHRTAQVAMDGSQKLPQRLLDTIRERRAAGAEPRHAILAVAAWMRLVSAGVSDGGRPLPLDDPLAGRLRDAAGPGERPAAVVDGLLGVPEVFGTDLPEDGTVRRLLTEALSTLAGAGVAAAVGALVERAHT